MGVRWSYSSQIKLEQVDFKLRRIVDMVRDMRDISIVTGHRDEVLQDLMFSGKPKRSHVEWPNSKHNSMPSRAIDVQPYPYVEKSLREDLSYIAGLFIAFGKAEGLPIRWGGDWDKDGETHDNKFDDLFHFEIIGS